MFVFQLTFVLVQNFFQNDFPWIFFANDRVKNIIKIVLIILFLDPDFWELIAFTLRMDMCFDHGLQSNTEGTLFIMNRIFLLCLLWSVLVIYFFSVAFLKSTASVKKIMLSHFFLDCLECCFATDLELRSLPQVIKFTTIRFILKRLSFEYIDNDKHFGFIFLL